MGLLGKAGGVAELQGSGCGCVLGAGCWVLGAGWCGCPHIAPRGLAGITFKMKIFSVRSLFTIGRRHSSGGNSRLLLGTMREGRKGGHTEALGLPVRLRWPPGPPYLFLRQAHRVVAPPSLCPLPSSPWLPPPASPMRCGLLHTQEQRMVNAHWDGLPPPLQPLGVMAKACLSQIPDHCLLPWS